jgi:hypothetical protein
MSTSPQIKRYFSKIVRSKNIEKEAGSGNQIAWQIFITSHSALRGMIIKPGRSNRLQKSSTESIEIRDLKEMYPDVATILQVKNRTKRDLGKNHTITMNKYIWFIAMVFICGALLICLLSSTILAEMG